MDFLPSTQPHLGKAEAGQHSDPVETLFLFQDVGQGKPGCRSRELFQCQNGFFLCHHISLIAQLVLPHEIRLLKFHLPQHRHIRIYSYPEQGGISTKADRNNRKIRIKVILQIKWLSCISPKKKPIYTLVVTQHHDCRSNLWEQQAQTMQYILLLIFPNKNHKTKILTWH